MNHFIFCVLVVLGFISQSFAQYDLTIIGCVDMSDGIGRMPVELVNALKDDFSVNLIPTDLNRRDLSEEILKIIDNSSKELGKIVIYEKPLSKNLPFFDLFQKSSNKIKMAYSMLESTEIPGYWVSIMNDVFDAILVPDSFLVEVYKNCGVTVPIFVMPLGMDLTPFLNEPLRTTKHDPLVFANFSTYQLRKNQIALIRGFYKAFGNDPSVKLWINGRRIHGNTFEPIKAEVKSLGVSNIVLTQHCFDKEQYLENFRKIDCYVSLSKGEGFSIQPREAMALGIPVIVSNNTAQTTICRSNLVKSVETPIIVPAYYENFGEVYGSQYDVDIEEVAQALRQMKAEYDEELKKASLRRSWAVQYDYTQLQPVYKSLVKPKKILLGKENVITEDYIITTSNELYRKYKNKVLMY